MSRYFPRALYVLVLGIAITGTASATTYYVATNGNDSNNGTSQSTPWAHVPGMATFTGSYTASAGDTITLRGCDDWGNSNFPLTWTHSGTSSAHVTIGGDQTWYNTSTCPSGWNRPIFDGGSAVMGGAECTGNNMFINAGSSQYVDFNWIELTGYYNNNGTCYGKERWISASSSGDFLTFNYFYIHNSKAGSSSKDIDNMISGGSSNTCPHCMVTYSVIDNSDGTIYTSGGITFALQHSICAYVSNCIKPATGGEYAYNDISHIGANIAGVHANCIETIGGTSAPYYIHDNRVHDVRECEGLQIGNPGETDYVWNNLWYNMTTSGANGPDIPQNCSTGVKALYYWNNTNVDQRNSCLSFDTCSGSNWTTAFVVQNNMCITSGTPSGSSQSGGMVSGGTVTGAASIKFSNNLTESLTVAKSQGYTSSQGFVYSPSSGSSPSVGVGANLTSSWLPGFSTDDTTYACNEQTVNGVVESVCPARTSNSRPTGSTPWDVGAYAFSSTSGGATPPSPPTGLTASVQ